MIEAWRYAIPTVDTFSKARLGVLAFEYEVYDEETGEIGSDGSHSPVPIDHRVARLRNSILSASVVPRRG
jgi:hypothetical protein